MFRTSIVALAATAVALGVIGAPAAAAPKTVTVIGKRIADDLPQARVGYGDLNLVTEAGQRTLNRRVDKAVDLVCEGHLGTGFQSLDHGRCLDFAWKGARPQIARAVQRANDLALTGQSSIAPVAIAISGAFTR